ncbi:unnamed protein product, partial [Choristocarpus tenellus]
YLIYLIAPQRTRVYLSVWSHIPLSNCNGVESEGNHPDKGYLSTFL